MEPHLRQPEGVTQPGVPARTWAAAASARVRLLRGGQLSDARTGQLKEPKIVGERRIWSGGAGGWLGAYCAYEM